MNDSQPPSLPERNPVTHQKHRGEVLWQITLPLAIGGVYVLVTTIIAISGEREAVSLWADISLVWLILPIIVITLVFTLILAALLYGVTRLLGALPLYARQAQNIFTLIGVRVRKGADAAVEPVLRIQGLLAAWRALRRKL